MFSALKQPFRRCPFKPCTRCLRVIIYLLIERERSALWAWLHMQLHLSSVPGGGWGLGGVMHQVGFKCARWLNESWSLCSVYAQPPWVPCVWGGLGCSRGALCPYQPRSDPGQSALLPLQLQTRPVCLKQGRERTAL